MFRINGNQYLFEMHSKLSFVTTFTLIVTSGLLTAIDSREIKVVVKSSINDTIAEWKEECEQFSNYPNLKCDESKVYLIDTTARDYESARDYCRELNTGKGISELITIDSCDEFYKIRDFLSDERIRAIESISNAKFPIVFWTSGYSSQEMIPNTGRSQVVYKWLSNKLIDKKALDKCLLPDASNGLKILQIRKTQSDIIARFTHFDSSELGFPLCQFISANSGVTVTTQMTTDSSSTPSTAVTEFSTVTTVTSEDTEESSECEPMTTRMNLTTQYEPIIEINKTATAITIAEITTIITDNDNLSETTVSIKCNCNEETWNAKFACDETEFVERQCQCVGCDCKWHYSCVKKFFDDIEVMISRKEEAIVIADKLVNKLVAANLSDGDLIKTVEIAENISDLFEQQRDKYNGTFGELARKIIRGYDVMLENRNSEAWKSLTSKLHTQVGQKMIRQISELGHNIACDNTGTDWSIDIVEKHISMESFSISGLITADFTFPSKRSNITTDNEVRFTDEIDPPNSDDSCGHSTASGVIYKNLSSKLNPRVSLIANSKLVAFSFTRNSSIKLPNNSRVAIRLKHDWPKRRGDKEKCMFWNFDEENWSTEGCRAVYSSKTFTICECDHLTNFAVLMDITGREMPNDAKTWLTLVCSTISMICLIITICALVSIKSLRSRRSVITTNLCVCLLVINLLTSFGLQQTQNPVLCQSISIILMYSVASAFLWMLLEGYILYQMIILVFHSVGHIRKRWMFCIGYGLSFVWVMTAVLIVKPKGFYDSDVNYFCWISNPERPGLIWIFVGPALVILALNFIVFILSLRATIIATLRKQTKKVEESNDLKPNIKRWLKGWTSLMILLGLSWLTALLYIHADLYFAAYIFIVFNGLQGFFIFLFEIVFNKKARNAILREVSTKIPLSKTSSTNPLTSIRTKSTSMLSMKNSNESCSKKNSNDFHNVNTVYNQAKTSF